MFNLQKSVNYAENYRLADNGRKEWGWARLGYDVP